MSDEREAANSLVEAIVVSIPILGPIAGGIWIAASRWARTRAELERAAADVEEIVELRAELASMREAILELQTIARAEGKDVRVSAHGG